MATTAHGATAPEANTLETCLIKSGATAGAKRPKQTFAQALEQAAAIVAAGTLVVMAAMPGNRDEVGKSSAAANGLTATAAPGRETTFGAYVGAPYHYPSDFRLQTDPANDVTLKKVEWYTNPFNNPLYYGARIQRWSANGTTGAMIDFLHSKAFAPKDQNVKMEGMLDGKPVPESGKIGDVFQKLEFSHGHNMLTLNGLLRFARFSNVIVPYAGVGAGVSLPHSEMQRTTDKGRTYEYQYTGPTAQALFGLEFRLRSGSIFLEYKFTIADYRAPHTYRDGSLFPIDMWSQFSRWWSGNEPPGGWGSTRLTSHQVIGGFLVRFAPETAAAP